MRRRRPRSFAAFIFGTLAQFATTASAKDVVDTPAPLNIEAAPGATLADDSSSSRIERVEIVGAHRTAHATILELLPRQPPAIYTDTELDELERRLRNLEIFDFVSVRRGEAGEGVEGGVPRVHVVRVTIREKWTLIPSVDFASGATLADTFFAVGATEYNFLGRASLLGLSVSHEQRGWNFILDFSEHAYRPDRWTVGGEAFYVTSGIRFDDSNDAWFRNRTGSTISLTSPMPHGSFWRYRVGATYLREVAEDPEGTYRPPNGHAIGTAMTLIWDRYVWNDLVPSGYRATLTVSPGWFFGPHPPQSRHRAELLLNGSLPLTRSTALMGRVVGGINSTGNSNFSMLVGSYSGVRGLEDALYRNWMQAYATVELRQTIRIAERWAVQPVLFADGAAFEQMDAHGERTARSAALGAGAGARIIPMALAGLLLRVDVARLLLPYENLFVQFGTSQYF